ncbi:MAG TPA: hypothetical protein EYP65_03460 [Armatimonadetes bacterium]|nr:hypothetical protein [Armatimonadota bacterium]
MFPPLVLLAPPQKVNPLDLLRQAIIAENKVALKGRRVVRRKRGRRIIHEAVQLVIREGLRSKTVFLSPPRLRGRAVLRLPKREIRVMPRCKVALEVPLPGTPAERLRRRYRLIARNFDVRLVGKDMVCGRPTFVLELRRRRLKGFPVLRLWIDAERKVILKSVARSPGGFSLEISFVKVRFVPKVPRRELDLPLRGFKRVRLYGPPTTDLEALERASPFPLSFPKRLPPGFVFESGAVGRTPRGPFVVLHFTDGVHTLSLFQWEAGRKPPFPRVGRAVRWTEGGKEFALISSLPRRLLSALSRHFRP